MNLVPLAMLLVLSADPGNGSRDRAIRSIAFSDIDLAVCSGGVVYTQFRHEWGGRTFAEGGCGRVAYSPNEWFLAYSQPASGVKIVLVGGPVHITPAPVPEGGEPIAFSRDSRLLAMTVRGRVTLVEAATGQIVRTLDNEPGRFTAFSWSPDGARIAAVDVGEHRLHVWSTLTGREAPLPARQEASHLAAAAFSPAGGTLALAAEDVVLVDFATGREQRRLSGQRDGILELAFSADGKRLASRAGDDSIWVWDVAAGKPLARFEEPGMDPVMAFSADGNAVARGTPQHIVDVWDVPDPPPENAAPAAPPAPRKLEPAFMVIADGGGSEGEAATKRTALVHRGIPGYGGFPAIVESSAVVGLRPGFWIVVAGVARDEGVAHRLQAFLRARSIPAYVRKVMVEKPDDLHLLVVGGSRVACQDPYHPKRSGRTQSLQILDDEDCVGECEGRGGEVLSHAGVGPGGQVVIPYTREQVPDGGRLYLGCREEEGDFRGLRMAAYPAFKGNPGLDDHASFPALERRITELPFVTCSCFFF